MATFAEAIAQLDRRATAARAAGAAAAANAMAGHFITHERDVTLVQSGTHRAGSPGAAARGEPPARVSGWLGDSFRMDRASPGGLSASALAGPTAIYSRVQELGAVITKEHGWMHWVDYGGSQYRHEVHVGPHPYMRPGVDQIIADGSLRRHAEEAFAAVVNAG